MADDAEPDIPLVKPLEALRFFRAKGFSFGFAWQDVWQEEHARAFTVAKAMTRDLLEDLRAAVDTAIDQGETLAQFGKKLRPILAEKGWWGRKLMADPETGEERVVQLGSPRRLKTIYRINMRTAQTAGRWERIQRSKKLFPYLRKVSVMDGRERPEHHVWHGTILLVDDPWWDTHAGQCGWGCRCQDQPVNQRMMDAKGWTVTRQPVRFPMVDYVNPRTGEITRLERGIDPGWAYNVGKAALDGQTPPPLGPGSDVAAARGVTVADLDPFFAAFGLAESAIARGRIFTDQGGWPLAISLGLFRDAGGRLELPDRARIRHLPAVATAIVDPVEIRWRWVRGADGTMLLMRRYIGTDAVVDFGRVGWRFHARGERGFSAARHAQGTMAWTEP
jgi:SPP1 gp7 family putative phage head morphogenesis protein